jgi:hypothetical protein
MEANGVDVFVLIDSGDIQPTIWLSTECVGNGRAGQCFERAGFAPPAVMA